MRDLAAQVMPVIRITQIPVTALAMQDNPVPVRDREQFLQVERLPHQTIRMINHDMPHTIASGDFQEPVPARPLTFPLPRRTIRINQNLSNRQPQVISGFPANPLGAALLK